MDERPGVVDLTIQAGDVDLLVNENNEPVNHVILEDIDRNTTIDAVIGRLIDGGMLSPFNNNTNNTSQITCSLRCNFIQCAPLCGTSTLEDNNITNNTVLIVTCRRQVCRRQGGGYKYKKAKRKTKRKAKRKTRIRRVSKKLKTKRISRGRKLRRRKTH